jgi:xylulokinase
MSIRQVVTESGVEPAQVAGVGLAGQMHGPVQLDAQGEVLRLCMLWNDQRPAAQCATITRDGGGSLWCSAARRRGRGYLRQL